MRIMSKVSRGNEEVIAPGPCEWRGESGSGGGWARGSNGDNDTGTSRLIDSRGDYGICVVTARN